MTTGTKVLIGVVITVMLLGMTCVGGLVFAGLWISTNAPEGVVIDFDYPDQIVVGDEFDVTITIDNLLDRPRTLVDIDWYRPILDGVSVVSISPVPKMDDGMYSMGFRTMSFNSTIPAEGQVVVVFTMTADEAGYHTGTVDVSIDQLFSIYGTTQTIIIEEDED